MFGRAEKREAEKLARDVERGTVSSPETASIIVRLKDSSPGDVGLNAGAYERILHKVGEAVSSGSSSSTRQLKSLARPGRIILAAGFVVVLVVLFLAVGAFRSPSDTLILQKALAAVEQPGKITHYRISTHLSKNSKPDTYGGGPNDLLWLREEPLSSRGEFWVDTRHKRVKVIYRYSFRNNKRMSSTVLVRNTVTYAVVRDENNKAYAYESDNPSMPGSFSHPMQDYIKQYRELLKSGKAEILGEETVDGIATYIVRETILGKPDGKGGPRSVITSNIRKDDYRPLRITYESWEADAKQSSAHIQTVLFDDFELMESGADSKSLFDFHIPEDAVRTVSRFHFSFDEAKVFQEFGLYYLGESFEGFELKGFEYHKGEEAISLRTHDIPDSKFSASYESPTQNGPYSDSLGIIVRPRIDYTVIDSSLAPGGRFIKPDKMRIGINGREARLYRLKLRGTFSYTLFINAGNSTIEIRAGSRVEKKAKALTISAVQSIKKIN